MQKPFGLWRSACHLYILALGEAESRSGSRFLLLHPGGHRPEWSPVREIVSYTYVLENTGEYHPCFLLAASGFIFRPRLHLELILCKAIDSGLISFFSVCASSFPSAICWKCFLFPVIQFWQFCQILYGLSCTYSCLGLWVYAVDLHICFGANTALFSCSGLAMHLKIWRASSRPALFLLLRTVLARLDLLWPLTHFKLAFFVLLSRIR